MDNFGLEKAAIIVIVVLFFIGLIDLELFLTLWVKIFIGVVFMGLLFSVLRSIFAR